MRRAFLFGVLGLGVVLAGWALLSSRENRDRPPAAPAGSAVRPSPAAIPLDVPPRTDGQSDDARPEPSASLHEADAVDAGLDEEARNLGDAPRVELLVGAGFTRERAEQIVQRDGELRQAAAYREYETTGTVRPLSGGAQLASDAGLRQELGDADYERYLAATGRPSRVIVAGVAEASAAANAGLLAGDEILSYGGERVFNLRELNDLAAARSIGETVAVAVVRDGQTLQLYVTGGSLGLTPLDLR